MTVLFAPKEQLISHMFIFNKTDARKLVIYGIDSVAEFNDLVMFVHGRFYNVLATRYKIAEDSQKRMGICMQIERTIEKNEKN